MEVIYQEANVDSGSSSKTTFQCDRVEEGEEGVYFSVIEEYDQPHVEGNSYKQIAYIYYQDLIQVKPSEDD